MFRYKKIITMKSLMVYILAAMMLISFSQCSKDGPQGPEGERGERGERGKQGEKGAKGDDGTSILSGKGSPSSSLGNEGDFYLDLSSSELYGPKTSSGWGTAVSIQGEKGDKGSKGDKGATGAKGDKGDRGATGAKGDKGDKGATGAKGQDGSQFLSGTAVPASSLGNVGDFYFRTSTSVLYGPKTSSGWGSGTSLKGPKGDKGEDGNANVRSSGWVALASSKWDTGGGGASPDDILSTPYSTNSFYALSKSEVDGVVLVYVRGLKRGRSTDVYMLPVKDEVYQNGKATTLELRFSHSGDLDYALWLDLFVGLQGSNSWDTSYMKNTYLPALEWKVVTIPPNVAKAEKNKLDRMDLNKYEEVKSYFNLED